MDHRAHSPPGRAWTAGAPAAVRRMLPGSRWARAAGAPGRRALLDGGHARHSQAGSSWRWVRPSGRRSRARPGSRCTSAAVRALGGENDLARGTGVCEKNVHLQNMRQVSSDAPCPQFQCCQAFSKMHGAKMDVFFAAGSTRSRDFANIEIGGEGDRRSKSFPEDGRFFRRHRNGGFGF